MTEGMRPCPFQLLDEWGDDRPAVDKLHSHAGSLQHNLTSPQAHPDDAQPSELLRAAEFVRELADEAMREVVGHVRSGGMTWEQVGAALGITRQAAQQRFGGAK